MRVPKRRYASVRFSQNAFSRGRTNAEDRACEAGAAQFYVVDGSGELLTLVILVTVDDSDILCPLALCEELRALGSQERAVNVGMERQAEGVVRGSLREKKQSTAVQS